jgi:phosphatidylinositol alpha-1,6-mannosyltransferase
LVEKVVPVRVLFCVTSLDRHDGGIASVNRNIVRALAGMATKAGPVELAVLAYHRGVPDVPAAYLDGHRFSRAVGCESSRRRFLQHFIRIGLAWRPDLVLIDHLHLSVIPYLCRWLVHVPYVVMCHGIEFDENLSPLRKAAFRRAAARLTNSCFTAERLRKMFPNVRIDPCELALDDVGMDESAREVTSLPDAFGTVRTLGDKIALIVGRLSAAERYKGHDQLIAIMPALIDQIPDAQLVIVGSGDDLERLKSLARDNGAGSAVLFSGFAQADLLAALYRRCRLFVMPSRGEGFGLVYLEAMRFAKPCLASRVDAGSEVVVDGETGLLVDPDNLDEMREALELVLGNEALAIRLGQAGLIRLNERFRFEHYRDRLRQNLARVAPFADENGF